MKGEVLGFYSYKHNISVCWGGGKLFGCAVIMNVTDGNNLFQIRLDDIKELTIGTLCKKKQDGVCIQKPRIYILTCSFIPPVWGRLFSSLLIQRN